MPKITGTTEASRPIPTIATEERGWQIPTVPVRTFTLAEERADRERARAEYCSRDILDRLRSRSPCEYEAIDRRAAIEEIEWLRASRPDAVTRGELADMAAQLRLMQQTIAALLARIGKDVGEA